MAVVYLNWRGSQGRETIDEVRSEDVPTWRAFRAETRRLCREYAMCGMSAYASSRACKGWNE